MTTESGDLNRTREIWSGDWQAKIDARLKSLGFESIKHFLDHFPAEPYVKVASRLGQDVAALQLIWMQFGEARGAGLYREAAKDCLTREITESLRQGWGVGGRLDFRTAMAYVQWVGWVTQLREDMEPVLDAVWRELIKLNPSLGWLPLGPDDPLIDAAFAKGWPEEST